MEVLLYMFDTVVAVLVIYWVIAASKRPAGTPVSGLFAYRETAAVKPEPPAEARNKGLLAHRPARK